MSTAMRFTPSLIFVPIFVVAASLANAAEQPANDSRDPGKLSKEASAAGPAVDTSKTTVPRSSDNDQKPAAQPSTQSSAMAQRASGPQPAVRNDRLDLDTTVVTGNRELPKVLYIVPWKKSELGELPAQPFNTLLDEALTPIDRDVFRREVTYYGAVASDREGGPDAAPSLPERSEK